MQKRMIDALETIPGVESVGLVDRLPLYYGANGANVFTDQTTDLRPANATGNAWTYNISPGYFDAARTTLLAGRKLSWHDDKSSPRVAVVNREFAAKDPWLGYRRSGRILQAAGWIARAGGGHCGRRKVCEPGRRSSSPAMFLPVLQQSPGNEMALVVRSNRDPQQLAKPSRARCGTWMRGCPLRSTRGTRNWTSALFPSRVATMALGVLGMMGAVLSITGIFGMAAYSVSKRLRELGIRIALGAQREEVLQAALGRAFKLLAVGSVVGLDPRDPGEPGAGFDRVSGDSARSAGAGRGRVGHGAVGSSGDVDSGATRAVGRSADPAARGVKIVLNTGTRRGSGA